MNAAQQELVQPKAVALAFTGISLLLILLSVEFRPWGDSQPLDGTLTVSTLILGILAGISVLRNGLSKITLTPVELKASGLMFRKTIDRAEISACSWRIGCGVILELKDGRLTHIPDLGNPRRVSTTIREWLNEIERL